MSKGWIILAAIFFVLSCFGGGLLYAKLLGPEGPHAPGLDTVDAGAR